jgi:ADP-dependent NAD(P)H-hydrate dehydratase
LPPAEIDVDRWVLDDHPLPRPEDGDTKNDRGTVVVIGGSVETPGGALLAGMAALRSGAGKTQLVLPCEVATQVAVAFPEARVVAVPSARGHAASLGACADALAQADAV